MSALDVVLILVASVAAGTINAVVGSGTLISFPVLLGLGYSPVTANMTNTVGLVFGGLGGVVGYRRELEGQARRALRFGACTVSGAIIGAVLLLTLPDSAFKGIVPVFIIVALLAVIFQRQLGRYLAHHRAHAPHGGALAMGLVFVLGIYGGYFGAAQGIMLLATFGLLLDETLQRSNALKQTLATTANVVGAIVFIIFGTIEWDVAGLIAVGSASGGLLGAHYGRRLPDAALRGIIVVVGCFAILKLWAGWP